MTSLRDMRVSELHQAGHSIRAVARRVGLSRSQVHRIISNPAPDMSPIAYLGPEDDDGDGDPWTDDDGLPLADDGTDQREPSEYLTPPFDFAGLVDVPDNMPTRRRDGKIHQAPQWTDAHGLPVSQLDLWRWGHWLHDIVMDDYPTREEYEAAWHAADAEIQAVNRHAWDSLHAAGVYHDDERRLWLKRPQAV